MPDAPKSVILSVSNDLFSDQRVDRTCSVFVELGYDVLLIGRKLPGSPLPGTRPYRTKRMRLWFNRGFLFYAEYNIRLFFRLLFSPADIFYANDLDTLPANYWAAKIRRKVLIYDSHEYFTEMPELDNPLAKKFWTFLERRLLPGSKYNITVSPSIAEIYEDKYGKPFRVIRNLPKRFRPDPQKTRAALHLPEDKAVVILQGGGINKDRGAEELIAASKYMPDVFIVILGGGDQMEQLKVLAKDAVARGRMLFVPRQSYENMMAYTVLADLGLSLEKATNMNMELSLPNKVFEYIQARIPVLSTSLREKKRLIETYGVGELIEDISPPLLAQKIKEMLTGESKRVYWKKQLDIASGELCWEHEKKKLIAFIRQIEKEEGIDG